jgi:MoxR-like ATPase
MPRLGEDEFKRILDENIRPAQPIENPDLLKGRGAKLKDIDRALSSAGMHVFIHGERGVGKTSLALTAAHQIYCGRWSGPA